MPLPARSDIGDVISNNDKSGGGVNSGSRIFARTLSDPKDRAKETLASESEDVRPVLMPSFSLGSSRTTLPRMSLSDFFSERLKLSKLPGENPASRQRSS